MEDKKIENLFAGTRATALTPDEKSAGREMLRSYMTLVPARVAASAPARRSFFANAGLHRGAVVASLVAAVTLSAAGVSYAAENALPGDTLYPVKVSVNEEVRAALATSEQDKASWEAERAERRLTEAETLAEKGELKAETRAAIEADFRKHADKAQEHIAKIAEQDDDHAAAEVSARIEGALDAHKQIIAAIVTNGRHGSREVERLGVTVDAQAEVSARASVEAEKRSDERETRSEERRKSAAEAGRVTAQGKIADARAVLDGTRVSLGEEASAQAEARLAAAEATVAEGDALAASGEYRGASDAYVKAQRQAQEAKTLIRAGERLKLRIDAQVRLNEADAKKKDAAASEDGTAWRSRSKGTWRGSAPQTVRQDARLKIDVGTSEESAQEEKPEEKPAPTADPEPIIGVEGRVQLHLGE